MLNVYLLRHGETAWNADGNRYCGRTDIALTEKGQQQARLVREQLESVQLDAVYSSPLERAFHTAQIATGREVVKDQRLIEVDFGRWETKKREEFVAEDPGSWSRWEQDPTNTRAGSTGETGLEVVTRVDDFFREALLRHPDGNILVTGHNGINRLYLAFKLGMDLKFYRRILQENSSVSLFSLDDAGEITLKRLNSRF